MRASRALRQRLGGSNLRCPRTTAEGAPDLGHLRLPEEPVGGSAAVPNLFARAYLRAHDPGPPAYLSFFCRG